MSSRLSFPKIAAALMLCLGSFGLTVAVASLDKPGWFTNTFRIATATIAPEATRSAPKATPQVAAPTGQTATASILITVVNSPTITGAAPATACAGSSVTLVAFITQGDLPVTYADFQVRDNANNILASSVVGALTNSGTSYTATAVYTVPANLSAGNALTLSVFAQCTGSSCTDSNRIALRQKSPANWRGFFICVGVALRS